MEEKIQLANNNIAKKELENSSPQYLESLSSNILDDIKNSCEQVDDVLRTFLDMVVNEGDASSSSKEALVNLIKIKSDFADKKIKVLDLSMRAYLRDRDTFPKYLSATQNNITIKGNNLRDILQEAKDENNEQQ